MKKISAVLVTLGYAGMAMAQSGKATGGAGGAFGQMLPMMLILFAIVYFLMIRPEQKKQKERQKMLDALKKGDKVVTAGGIHGTVNSVKDKTVMVKISDTVVVEVSRGSITAIGNDTTKGEKEIVKGDKDTTKS
jgi:preprotein translocase subunit YajC